MRLKKKKIKDQTRDAKSAEPPSEENGGDKRIQKAVPSTMERRNRVPRVNGKNKKNLVAREMDRNDARWSTIAMVSDNDKGKARHACTGTSLANVNGRGPLTIL